MEPLVPEPVDTGPARPERPELPHTVSLSGRLTAPLPPGFDGSALPTGSHTVTVPAPDDAEFDVTATVSAPEPGSVVLNLHARRGR
ncbi:MAG: hypothetical protein ACRYF3_14650 [Janthinobacterium lividum]